MDSCSGHPYLEECKDYSIMKDVFSESELQRYEAELAEYLDIVDNEEGYLNHVPRIVCWYEGLVTTEEFIQETYTQAI